MKVVSYHGAVVDDAWPVFNEKDDGYFRCDESGNPNWCTHLAKMMSHNLDAEVWVKVIGENGGNEIKVMVPMVPTLAVFVEVHLLPITLGKSPVANSAEVVYMKNSGSYAGFSSSSHKPDETLGYMSFGDGLSSLRWMMFEWFEGNILPELDSLLTCKKSTHKYTAERKWQADLARPNAKLAQKFIVWVTESCMSCRTGRNADWDDDLIPVPGGNKTPWNK